MRRVLLRIMFSHSGHSLDVVMKEDDARALLDSWKQKKVQEFFSGYDTELDRHYVIKMSEVAGIFTLNWELVKQQQEEARRAQQAGNSNISIAELKRAQEEKKRQESAQNPGPSMPPGW